MGAEAPEGAEVIDAMVKRHKRDACALVRRLERAAKVGTPVQLTPVEAGAVLTVLRAWAGAR